MEKGRYRGICISIFILFSLFTAGCNKLQPFSGKAGFLKGTIHIGPICPVERIPPDPACQPTAETYKAYPVSVWTSNGRERIEQITPALDGLYAVRLIPGDYLVVLERGKNLPGGSNLPQLINILPGDTTLLQINIDTGIR